MCASALRPTTTATPASAAVLSNHRSPSARRQLEARGGEAERRAALRARAQAPSQAPRHEAVPDLRPLAAREHEARGGDRARDGPCAADAAAVREGRQDAERLPR